MGILYIALGGALGAVARYGLSGWVHTFAGASFPWGTLVVNVVGSAVLGFAYRSLEASVASPELRQAVTIGLIGAFTTFSTFTLEGIELLRAGELGHAALYLIGSVALGLVAVLGGFLLANTFLQPRM